MILDYLRSLLFSNAPIRLKVSRRPTGAQLRNSTDPVQAARIQAAVAKRERKAEKLSRHTYESSSENMAHDTHRRCHALNPFYIAK